MARTIIVTRGQGWRLYVGRPASRGVGGWYCTAWGVSESHCRQGEERLLTARSVDTHSRLRRPRAWSGLKYMCTMSEDRSHMKDSSHARIRFQTLQ